MSELNSQPGSMSARALMLTLAVSFFVSAFILVAAILPGEYGRDPTGLGDWTGLSRLWAPEEQRIDPNAGDHARAHDYQLPLRTNVISIELEPMGRLGAKYEIEYKVHMQKNASLVFEWEAIGTEESEDFYYDFHGHTLPKSGDSTLNGSKASEPMTVAVYKQDSAQSARGALTAPFEGIHGWYFQNSAAGKVTVKIRISGFYDLIPPGAMGNEAAILPVK